MIREHDTVIVTEGVYIDKQGTVEVLAGADVPKRIGVRVGGALVWFTPTEIQVTETHGDRRINRDTDTKAAH